MENPSVATAPVADPAGPTRARTVTLAVCALVLLAAVAGLLLSWRSADAYVGATRSATLSWSCGNGIFWTDPTSHTIWWAGHDPAPTGLLDTAEPGPGVPPTHRASGRVHFDSRTDATFTSAAGGTLELTRQKKGAMYTADCRIGP